MAIYWNVYAKPYSCAEEFVSSYSNKRDARAEIRALEDVYPTDCDGIPCRYYMRQGRDPCLGGRLPDGL